MSNITVRAQDFKVHALDSGTESPLARTLADLRPFVYQYIINAPSVNSGQMQSDFDDRLEEMILSQGAESVLFQCPPEIPQKLDFAFCFQGDVVAVEVEKSNREKILRDILKAHMYLDCGAHYALIVLPRNYPHAHGVWNLFDFGVRRYDECARHGFGTADKLGRILLLGFTQVDPITGRPLDTVWREQMRAAKQEDVQ